MLDTPGSRVNVFSVPAAEELLAILRSIDFDVTRALVIRSGKPRSFVNGVGLMLANAVKTEEDASRLTEPVRAAYTALRELPIPTIAVIEGSCFGCGVELAMHCRHRVAVDVGDTQFYMTEIVDYLFVPVFGATRDLPRLVGLRNATELLLWGMKWNAFEATAGGLVDACIDKHSRDVEIAEFVERVTLTPFRPTWFLERSLDAIALENKARIALLPLDQREVHTSCFELLERSARGLDDDDSARERERDACGRSAMSTQSKAAQGFFFVRQVADGRCRVGPVETPRTTVELHRVPVLEEVFRARFDPDIRIRSVVARSRRDSDACRAEDEGGFLDALRVSLAAPPTMVVEDSLASSQVRELPAMVDALAHVSVGTDETIWTAPVLVSVFATDGPERFAEVASREGERNIDGRDPGALIYSLLERVGVRVVRSRAETRFVASTLLDAFAAPLVRYVARGGRSHDAARALRDFGFVHTPRAELFGRLGPAHRVLSRVDDTFSPAPFITSAVVVSLLAWARDALERGLLAHPSIVDVMATDLLGFPVARGGLCRSLTTESVRAILTKSASLAALVDPSTLASAEEFVARGKPIYRS